MIGPTVLSGLVSQVQAGPDETALVFLDDGETPGLTLTWSELDRAARGYAAGLQARKMMGATVVIALPSGAEFLAVLLACFYAGAIAVPAPPLRLRSAYDVERLEGMVSDCAAALLVVPRDLSDGQAKCSPGSPLRGLPWTSAAALRDGSPYVARLSDPIDIAFLQYTSGSTTRPKGVVVRHRNLVANFEAIAACVDFSAPPTFVSWLPLHHDMGLIAKALQAIFRGRPLVLMSPAHFLQNPLRWLQAISTYGGTFSGAPDFAYRACAERVAQSGDLEIDLRSWTVAFNGAEPVRPDTISAFTTALAPYGFRSKAMRPVYGMAETTLMFTASDRTKDPVIARVDRSSFRCGSLRPAQASATVDIVSAGKPMPGHDVVVVDPETLDERAAGDVGEILVSGPSVCDGYWSSASGEAETLAVNLQSRPERWFRTGDLGALFDGELYVTGRLKDVLIIRGRNLYPQDLERSAKEACADYLPGAVAVLQDDMDGGIVVIQELRRPWSEDLQNVSSRITAAIVRDHEVRPKRVIFVKSGSLLQTTSGKLRRAANLEALRQSEFDIYADLSPSSSSRRVGHG